MEPTADLDQRIAAVAALDQPVRRRLYRALVDAGAWTTRDDAADAVGVPRSVAAFHLDKLAEAGVLDVRFERLSGRQGPGAGRPSKLYRPSQPELAASVPDRHYDLAGALLADAVAASAATGVPVGQCLHTVARDAGRRLGEATGATATDVRPAVEDVLTAHGYEPVAGGPHEIALANCPFHRLAEAHRELVCGMNLDFLTGLLDGAAAGDALTARLAPEPGWCCVRLATR